MKETQKRDSALTRTGVKAVLILLGSILVTIACLGFIYFLWYGTIDNKTWRLIIINNWAIRAISFTTIVLRLAVGLTGGLCLSMLAAIVLERSAVPLASIASVSLIRAGGDKGLVSVLFGFVKPMLWSGRRFEQFVLPTVLLVLTTLSLSQFFSVALLSDVTVKTVPGYYKTVNLTYDSAYQANNGSFGMTYGYQFAQLTAASLWAAPVPSLWPMFAEYSERPIVQDSVSDTGVSLRAFLPLNADERPLIRNYKGKALVLDTRVTCQQPLLYNLTTNGLEDEYYAFLTGSVGPSTSTPRLDKPDVVPFACLLSSEEWSICELNEEALVGTVNGLRYPEGLDSDDFNPQFSGGLVSEFREFPLSPRQNKSGAAFLLITGTGSSDLGNKSSILENREFTSFEAEFHRNPGASFAATLCYTSLDVADRWIDAFSATNRTEATPSWGGGVYNFTGDGMNPRHGYDGNLTALAALFDTGYTSTSSPPSLEDRGIMGIRPSTKWSAPQSNEPSNDGPSTFGQNKLTAGSYYEMPCLTWRLHLAASAGRGAGYLYASVGNYSAAMSQGADRAPLPSYNGVISDQWLSELFNHFMTTRSSSVALQAVITALASIEYYSRLEQFDKSANVSTVYFIDANTPGGQFGHRRKTMPKGLLAVLVVLIVHTTLVIGITVRFLVQTKVSRIGDDWQAIAQVALSNVDVLKKGLEGTIIPGAGRDVVTSVDHVYVPDEGGVTLRTKLSTVRP